MMTVDKRLLRVREKIRRSRPKFRRQESWRYKRLKTGWRKPMGIDNSMRHHKRGIPTIVRVGFRGPKATRGLTRTGKVEVLIHNTYDLEEIEKEMDNQGQFVSELHDFKDKLRRAADLNLIPNLNDGVALNIAPLWELVPWKEAKKYWEELSEGKYEWSSIAKQFREKKLVKP